MSTLFAHVMTGGLSCAEVDALLDSAIDGELPLLTRWRLKLHRATCRMCGRYASQYGVTVERAKAAFDEPAPDIPSETADRIARRATGRPPDD